MPTIDIPLPPTLSLALGPTEKWLWLLALGVSFGTSWGDTQHPRVPRPGAELQKLHYH